jgi:hypothetical protein
VLQNQTTQMISLSMDFAICYEHTNDTDIKIEHQMVRKQEKQTNRYIERSRSSGSQNLSFKVIMFSG